MTDVLCTPIDGDIQKLIAETVFWYENPGKITGVPTGFRDVDFHTGGLEAGTLTIEAGRPGMGKSALVSNIADNVCEAILRDAGGDLDQKGRVLMFAQEMSREAVWRRRAARLAQVNFMDLKRGQYRHQGVLVQTEREQYRAYADALKRLKNYPLLLHSGRITTALMHDTIKRVQDSGLDVKLVVDDGIYLHADTIGGDNEVVRLGNIANGLKGMALDANVPILGVHQLSRGVESRENKNPMLSDLRGSGDMEQAGDDIWFLYRPEYYVTDPSQVPHKQRGMATLNFAKARNNEGATVKLRWTGKFFSFTDWEDAD
jgi:replicative DNA helicase